MTSASTEYIHKGDPSFPFEFDGTRIDIGSFIYLDPLWDLAREGESLHSTATYPNNARQLVKCGGYLHQIFFSDWEIFYRRQPEGGAWENTARISNGDGGNRYACIAYGDNCVFVLWQRMYQQSGFYRFDILFRKYDSVNGWSVPTSIATGLAMSSYQAQPLPVLAFDPDSEILYAIYCCDQGLLYRTSSDGGSNWSGTASTISSSNRVRYPSVSFNNDRMVVLYERRYQGIWSNYFSNYTWSGEVRIDSDLSINSPFTPSVTLDKNGKPHATWIAYPSGYGKYSIIFRRGNSDNTWNGTWHEIRYASNYNFRNPSISLHPYSLYSHNIIICHSDDNNAVFVQYYEKQSDKWNKTQLSGTGKYPGMSEEFSINEDPFVRFTNQNQSPYLVEEEMIDDGFAKRPAFVNNEALREPLEFVKRVGVFTNKADNSRLILDIELITGSSSDGSDVEIPFNVLPVLDSVSIDWNNVGYYLGINGINLDERISDLKIKLSIREVSEQDSTSSEVKSFPADSYDLGVKIVDVSNEKNAIVVNLDQSTSLNVDVRNFAGKTVNINPVIQLKKQVASDIGITVGNVYLVAEPSVKKEHSEELIARENLPETFELLQNYPNPFNPETTIRFELPQIAEIELKIYNLLGQQVRRIQTVNSLPGVNEVIWDGKNSAGQQMSSGVYLYTITANTLDEQKRTYHASGKMVLLK